MDSTRDNPQPLSIVIPTYMREQVLWSSVTALRSQFLAGDELLIIDQNIPSLVLPPDLAGPWVRLCRLDVPSLTQARNLGIRLAKQDRVVFLDDDIEPDPDLLSRLKQATTDHPEWIITGIVDQEDKPEDVPTPGYVNLSNGEIRTNFSRPLDGEVPFFPGCLVLIPKKSLPPEPWFCPAFRGASQGEEIDFSLRVRSRGVKIHSDSSIRIFHLKVVEGGCRSPEFRQRFFLDQVFNQSLFYGRHGILRHLPSFFARLKQLIEFHSRKPGRDSHAPLLVGSALVKMGTGLLTGIFYRRGGSKNARTLP